MKKMITIAAISALVLGMNTKSKAQLSISINIGTPVVAASVPVVVSQPVVADVSSYYYYPDINVYFDPVQALYYLFNGNSWIAYNNRPAQFANYNFDRARRVAYNRNDFNKRTGITPLANNRIMNNSGANRSYNNNAIAMNQNRGDRNNNIGRDNDRNNRNFNNNGGHMNRGGRF